MDAPRRVTIPFDVFIKRSWPLLAVGAVFILVACGALLWFAVSGKGRKTNAPAVNTATSTEAIASTSTDALVPRALDGVLVSPLEAQLMRFAVMIDNSPEARPQSGLAEANVVVEIPVEGGITRYMAIFDATSTVDQIGPVRSARPYFVDIAEGLDAVYAHVGGSPDALDQLKSDKNVMNLDEYVNGSSFWRSGKRAAPHNVYTRMDLLRSAVQTKNWTTTNLRGWRYADDAPTESTSSTPRGNVAGPKLTYPIERVNWSYDRDVNMYVRSLNGAAHVDLDATQIKAKNIIVLSTDAQTLDAAGRLKLRTTGRGTATLYHDGRKQEMNWYRANGDWFRFEATDGSDVTLTRGTTWIQIVTDGSAASTSGAKTSTTSTRP